MRAPSFQLRAWRRLSRYDSQMRLALALVLALSACGAKATSAPAWPKQADKEVDGGESIAPRNKAAAAVAESDDDDDDAVVTVATPAAAATDKPKETPATLPV